MAEKPEIREDAIRRQILNQIHSDGYRPIKPRQLAERIGIPKESAHQVRRVIRDMARIGEVQYGASHLVCTPESAQRDNKRKSSKKQDPLPESREKSGKNTAKHRAAAASAKEDSPKTAVKKQTKNPVKKPRRSSGRFQGIFRRLSTGDGIVRLFPSGKMYASGERDEFFIPRSMTLDAAGGDTVEIVPVSERAESKRRSASGSRRGRPSSRGFGEMPVPPDRAEVVEIVERNTNRFVGTYFTERGQAFVEVDGTLFKRPVRVGDAAGTRAVSGDKVLLEMTHFPSHYSRGEGVILEVLGSHGEPGLDTKLILRQYGLSEQFPAKVLREARDQVYEFEKIAELDDEAALSPDGEAKIHQALLPRTDLTGELVVTIDPEDAQDFDDAVSLVRTEKKGYQLGVHIADVAHFVRKGTALDAEALRRGTSVYLPDCVIPMLPEVICNALASLQPGRLRLTKSVLLDFTASGILTGVRVVRSYIRSRQRLSYDEADSYLADPASIKGSLQPGVGLLLKRMARLAGLIRQRRIKRGGIEFNFPEIRLALDENGAVSGVKREESTPAKRMIEDFMLAANRAVAEWLTEREIPFLRRIHPVPNLEKLENLGSFIRSLGIDLSDISITAGNVIDRFSIQKLLEQVHGTAHEEAVMYALLRSMPKAVYSPEEEGHFALAMENYTHFTSPIRRYPDLTIHRLIDSVLDGNDGKGGKDEKGGKNRKGGFLPRRDLIPLGQRLSHAEQQAEEAERELKKLKLIEFMRRHIGKTMLGVVTGIERFGFFVRGKTVPAEGLVHIDTLTDDYYHYDRELQILTGLRKNNIIRLGDEVAVQIRTADPDARRLDFYLVQRGSHRQNSNKKGNNKKER